MSTPVEEPHRTTAANDPSVSAASGRDETAAMSSPGGAPAAPRFGPPAAEGEVGVLGPYRVLKELGKGGMGAVYLAFDTRLDRKLAMKVMLPEFAADPAAKERFLREARAAAKVSHDNVVTVYEADERDGVPYITMQLLQGYPLDEYLKQKGAPPLPHVVRIGAQTALGLAAAHAHGLVHRDIKPANLWLEAPNGRVKVLDFGLAKPIGSGAELTKSGAIVGTPAYMSPEQARGLKVDARTDLFSLGAVLYRLCAGRNPFVGDHVMAVLAALITDEPQPVRELNPNVPAALAALIHQLLAKKPEDRPQTATEVAKRLRTILDQPTGPAVAQPPVARPGASDVSTSQPVVLDARPQQPPLLTPMLISAASQSAFVDLGAGEATEAEPAVAAPKPARKKTGVLILAGVAVVLAAVAGAIIIANANKDGPVVEVKGPDGSKGEVKGKTATPTPKPADPATPGDPLPWNYKNSISMEFVKVPKGTAWLGGGGGKPGETKVAFEQDFYLGKYEVTQEEWEKVTGQTPSHFSRTGTGREAVKDVPDVDLLRYPVESVSWDDCQTYIERLNQHEKESGWVYRLPTAAEWEYACRGGPIDKSDSAYDFYAPKPSNTLLLVQANFAPAEGQGLQRTCKVGAYIARNSLGLYGMHGNVWEWCDDTEKAADGASHRVGRGGDWKYGSESCRAAKHGTWAPSSRSYGIGLRLARVPAAAAGKGSAADPKPDVPGMFTNGVGMKFVPVPKGTGWLGGGGGKPGETKVEIKADFYLGKYEVTQEEWETIMGSNPSHCSRNGGGKDAVKDIPDADLKRFPVEMVSWEDCQLFIKRLNEKEKESGWVYRLPKEAEWEYACRGGPVDKSESAFDFYFAKPTNTLLPKQANFDNVLKRTCQAGSYEPNLLGLYEMHGNVHELCDDASTDTDGASVRVSRGGYWDYDSRYCRAAHRNTFPPSHRSFNMGLRLARVPSASAGKVSAADPKPDVPGTFTNGVGMKFVPVPKGTGWLGGGRGKLGETKVEFPADFFLGKYEVTQEEWEKVTGLNRSHFSRDGQGKELVKDVADADLKRFPVDQVSWDDCQLFLKKLNETEKEAGWVYRLPTEAEWEYACRGGPVDKLASGFDFYFARPADAMVPAQANFDAKLKRTCQVGSYEPNALGLFDMHGNVAEWCAKTDPSDAEVWHRGGFWFHNADGCRAASRQTTPPSQRLSNLGLRVARVPAAPAGK